MIEISNKWRRLKKEYSILVSDDLEKLRQNQKFCCINWTGMRWQQTREYSGIQHEGEGSIAIS